MSRNEFNKGLLIFLTVMFLMVLQTCAQNFFKINFIVPDLLFAFAVSFACTQEKWQTVLLTAALCAIFSDFVCHSHFLGYMAVYTYSALGAYFLKNLFIKPNIFFLSVIALLLFICAKTVMYPSFYLAARVGFADYFLNDTLPVSLYNTVCFFVFTLVLNSIKKRGAKRDAG